MNVSEALSIAQKKFQKCSETPLQDAELLLAFCLKKPESFLLAHPEALLSHLEVSSFFSLVERRSEGFSVAVLLQKKFFFGRDFFVNQEVLVPRPESEMLVEIMLPLLRAAEGGTLLDIGTGSGILAISLALELRKADVDGLSAWSFFGGDISPEAFAVAQKNAKIWNIPLSLFCGDFSLLFSKHLHCIQKNPLFLVANLPYLPEGNIHFSAEKEPKIALFSGEDGLLAYRRLFSLLQHHSFQALVFEFHPPQQPFLEKCLSLSFPKHSLDFFHDLSGHYRVAKLEKR